MTQIVHKLLQPKVLIPVVLSVALLVALLAFADVGKVVALMEGFQKVSLLWFLLLMIAYEAIRGVQWRVLLKSMDIHVPLPTQVFSFAVSTATLAVAVLAVLVMAFFLTVQKTFTLDFVTTLPRSSRPRTARAGPCAPRGRAYGRLGGRPDHHHRILCRRVQRGPRPHPRPQRGEHRADYRPARDHPLRRRVFGGFIGLLLAVLVALTVNPTLIIWVVILYLIVTNVEAHILVPLIYGRTVHIHPFLVIVALLFGAEAFGIIGAIIAVPIAAALQVVVMGIYVRDVVTPADEGRGARATLKRPLVDLTLLPGARRLRRHAR